jgi:hypothetical protein
MEAEVNYKIDDAQGQVTSQGQAKANLDEKYLTLNVKFGQPMLFAYTDIVGISEQEYQFDLFLTSKEKLNLSGLGYNYENFLAELYRQRNQLMLKYLLMNELLIKGGFEAVFNSIDSQGRINLSDRCEVRLYETALIILPQKNDPIRIPYCYLSQTSEIDYKLVLTTEFGEKFEFSMLGEKFNALVKDLSDAYNKLMLRSQQTIKEIIPQADPATITKLAVLMKDGRTAKRKDLEAISPIFWQRLVKKIIEADENQEFTFLESKALKDQMHIGIKRGLIGDLTGSYIWMLVPLLNDSGKLANAVALEAFSAKAINSPNIQNQLEAPQREIEQESNNEKEPSSGGKATYFFKILNQSKYLEATQEQLNAELDDFIKIMDRCMIDINFRRESIYLTNEALENPRYVHYQFAVVKLPSLVKLRKHFIGRVVHSSFDQWKNGVNSLLDFNAKSEDDLTKWRKGAE